MKKATGETRKCTITYCKNSLVERRDMTANNFPNVTYDWGNVQDATLMSATHQHSPAYNPNFFLPLPQAMNLGDV